MSIYSRDYMRDDERSRRPGGPSSWSVVTRLLIANAFVYLFHNLIFYSPGRDLFGLSLDSLRSFRLWTPLTYQFVHANLWHLLANGLGLFYFGRFLLQLVNPGKVLAIYLLGGLAGGFLQLLWNATIGPDAIIVGASASVLAIAFAVTTRIPHQRLQLLLFFVLPVSLTMRQIALILVAINVATLLFGFGATEANPVAVMAHFGGILFGWAQARIEGRRGYIEIVPRNRQTRLRGGGGPVRSERREGNRDPAAGSARERRSGREKSKPFVTGEVDAILDKINEHGFQSLTAEERRLLEKSSERLSRRIDQDPG